MAGWSLAALQVRCLGTAGGCIGAAIGAFLGFSVVGAMTSNFLLAISGLPVGALIGMLVGLFVSLRLMAR